MTPGLCLAAGALHVALATGHFTLAWTHSIEKIRWEEDYAVRHDGLALEQARIHGSGAGMEPPEGAELRGGTWHYRPRTATVARVVLARSRYTADYELCLEGRCRPLADYIPIDAGPTTLQPCDASAPRPPSPAGSRRPPG